MQVNNIAICLFSRFNNSCASEIILNLSLHFLHSSVAFAPRVGLMVLVTWIFYWLFSHRSCCVDDYLNF